MAKNWNYTGHPSARGRANLPFPPDGRKPNEVFYDTLNDHPNTGTGLPRYNDRRDLYVPNEGKGERQVK